MDEPLTNLDAELRADMRTEIKHLQARLGTTMVYVTHDQLEAMSLGHRIAILNKGRLEQVGTPLEVYDRPATLFCAALHRLPADEPRGGRGGRRRAARDRRAGPHAAGRPAARPRARGRGPAGGAGGHRTGAERRGPGAGRLGGGARRRDDLRRRGGRAGSARPHAADGPLRAGERRSGCATPAARRRSTTRARSCWWPDGKRSARKVCARPSAT